MRCASTRGNLLLAAAAVVIGCMPFYASAYHMQLATAAMIAAMFALSLQLLVGRRRHGQSRAGGVLRHRRLCRASSRPRTRRATADPAQSAGLGRGRGHRRIRDRTIRRAHARVLLPDDDTRVRADAVLRVPRHADRRRSGWRVHPASRSRLHGDATRPHTGVPADQSRYADGNIRAAVVADAHVVRSHVARASVPTRTACGPWATTSHA